LPGLIHNQTDEPEPLVKIIGNQLHC